MTIRTIINNIFRAIVLVPMIRMFPIKIHLMEMSNNVVVIIELVYQVLFYVISSYMDLDTREGWTSLSL